MKATPKPIYAMLFTALAILCMGIASCSSNEPSGKAKHVADAVDLGLSVKWASHNVGALEAESTGGLYGWSDCTGSRRTQANIELYYTNDGMTFVKWGSTLYGGITPPSNICASDSDIARYSWGGTWRLPTKKEMHELIDKCTWSEITTINSKPCVKVTGPNGKYIILPVAGYRSNETSVGLRGTNLCYWTGERCSAADQESWKIKSGQLSTAWSLNVSKQERQMEPQVRSFGLSVRPVCD